MSKTRKDSKRNWTAVDAHFRNSAGPMRDKQLERKNRKNVRFTSEELTPEEFYQEYMTDPFDFDEM